MNELTSGELASIAGGGIVDTIENGAYSAYKTVVSYPTAAFGGYRRGRGSATEQRAQRRAS
jgi:hypothetical protein